MTITPRKPREGTCIHGNYVGEQRGWDRYNRSRIQSAKNLELSLVSVLQREIGNFHEIEMSPGILGGPPRIAGTRIPVSMVVDAVQYYGDLKGAIKSYPDLTIEQVKQALSFSAAVLECRVGEEKP